MSSPLEDVAVGMEEEEEQRPLNRALLHRSATNNTSQVAMVGSNPCPIESLDYEMIENELFDQNWRTRSKGDQVRYVVLKWAFCLAIGILTGIVGFVINLAVENVAGFKHQAVSALMDSASYWTAFWVFAVGNLALLLLASSITAFVSPAAGGSGIPEVKAYLNGVDAPNIFSLRTLAVKVVGNIAAVSSSLHVGKAGPMVHTGACIAAIFGQGGSRKYGLTCRWLRYFKNDRDRRDLVTIGAGAGVAAAFRAPVGGVLLALESLSSWWRSALIWRSFFTTAVVAVVLRLFIELCGSGRCGLFGRGGLIMYDVSTLFDDDLMSYHLKDIPTVILIGVAGALLGALYNFLMMKVLRVYNAINERGGAHKLLLAATVSIVTSCCVFGLPWLAPCRPCPTTGLLASPPDGTCHGLNRFRPAVPLPGGALQRPGEPVPQHQRRRDPQPLLHGHQRRVPPGVHGHLLRGVVRARRAELRRGGAVGAVRAHHPHGRHLRPPRRDAARRPVRVRPRPRPRRHPRLRVLPRRDAPDDGVRVRHRPRAHQQPAPAAARHARAAHLQDSRRLLQLQHLRPHPAPQGPAPPRRPRRAVHAAAGRRRRGGRPAAGLRRRREGRQRRARAPDHGAPRVPRRGRAAAGAGARRALRPGAARAPAGAAQEEGVPGGAGAVPEGARGREVPGGGLRQAWVREAGRHRRRGAVAGGDGDVRGPAPLHQHVAVHGGRDHVAGQGARAVPGGRPAPCPRPATGRRWSAS